MEGENCVASIPEPMRKLRLDILHAHQRYLGMEPRHDSKLSADFAAGVAHWLYGDAWTVAEELVIVDGLYQRTLYGEIIETVMRNVAGDYKRRFPRVSWTQVWQTVRFYVPLMLKLYCFDAFLIR